MFINVHWSVPRPVNTLFTGRTKILGKIKDALCPGDKSYSGDLQRRFVITGLGGQGKSEVCLKVADLVRQAYVNSPS
jgi:hypothetical protein